MKSKTKDPCGAVPARLSLGLLTSAGVVILYMLRINISVAIVAMVEVAPSSPIVTSSFNGQGENSTANIISRQNSTADIFSRQTSASGENVPYCLAITGVNGSTPPSKTERGTKDTWVLEIEDIEDTGLYNITEFTIKEEPGEGDGTSKMLLTGAQKGFVLGAFFYGYTITNIPGGRMAEVYGTKKVFGGAILIGGLLTLLTPLAARAHYIVLIVLRALIGLSNGVVYPSLNAMVARWIPPLERPRFMSFTYMSNTLGTVITLPLCGLIIAWMGWPAVFYFTGGLSLLWVLLWGLLMYDTPDLHPRISEEEQVHILEGLKEESDKEKPSKTPWKSILLSFPLWATTLAHTGSMFGFNLLLTQLPTYMATILGFSITSNGFLSALPFLTQFLGSTVTGVLSGWLLTNNIITTRTSRRIFATVSLVIPGIVLVVVGYTGCHSALAVTFLCVGTMCAGSICSGHLANHLDLSPNFAGTLYGVSNTVAFLVTMCVPVIVGAMTPDQTLEQWQGVFWMAAGVYVFNWLIFVVFCSTEIQPWNSEQDKSEADTREEEKFLPADDKSKSDNMNNEHTEA